MPMKSPDEIKKGLECHARPCGCDMGCPYVDVCNEDEGCPMSADALALIQQQEAKNNMLYHTLIGVMHFVDKWLDDAGYDPESDADGSIASNRAAKAREIALKAIEEAENRPTF